MTALHLAARGHHVIATGRKSTDLAKLQAEAAQSSSDASFGVYAAATT